MNTYVKSCGPRRGYKAYPTFSNLFNEVLTTGLEKDTSRVITRPLANIKKSDESYTISLAIPGFNKEDIEIHLEQNKLTIATEQSDTDTEKFRLKEFSYKGVKRAFTLPKNIDTSSIQATYEAGVLALTLPIKAEAKPRTIEVG